MKKQLLLSLFTYILLTISANAQLGFTCSNAIQITSVPYQTIDNTANYGDLTDVSQGVSCGDYPSGTNYLAGNEVFYNYVSDFTGYLSISMLPLGETSTNSAVFVYQDCSNVGAACAGGMANATTDLRELNLLVFEGQTYKIVVSSSALTQTVAYKLTLEKNQCSPKPTNLAASSLNTNSATLTWGNPGNYSSWQIEVQPAGSSIPSGAGEATTTSEFTKYGLTPNTAYQYWVRGECTAGNNTFSQWAGPFVFNTTLCTNSDRCNYTFVLSDSAGNGWNGATMQVKQNGFLVGTFGQNYTSNLPSSTITMALCKNVPFEIVWNNPGTAPEEIGLTIKNSFGQILYVKQATDLPNTTIYSGANVNCSATICFEKPSNVVATQLTSTSAVANWTSAAAESWDIFVIPSNQSTFPNELTVPTYSNVQKPFTIGGLTQNTGYKIFVRSNCSSYIKSAWSVLSSFNLVTTCFTPGNLITSEITTTSAKVTWQTSVLNNYDVWEILVMPIVSGTIPVTNPGYTPVVEEGAFITTVNSTTTETVLSNLTISTNYVYYIRAVCSTTDKSDWSAPALFSTAVCITENKCNYKFMLTNPIGNSWNGAKIQVIQNGVILKTLNTPVNNNSAIIVGLCTNVPFSLYWSDGGLLPQNVGLSIMTPFDDVIYTKLAGEGTPLTTLFSTNVNCAGPTCPKPNILSVLSTTQTTAQLSWTETGSATQWEVYVAAPEMPLPINGTPLNTGVASYFLANTNLYFEVSGLLASTNYTFYVRSICSSTDIGNWTIYDAKSFNTIPVNDECANATSIPVNTSIYNDQITSGTTIGGTTSLEISTCPGTENDDVWFSFVATNTTHLVNLLNVTGSTINIRMAAYSGSNCAEMYQLFCSATNQNSSVLVNLIVGTTYKIRVYTNGNNPNQSASFDISITTPPLITNDECETAILVPVTNNASLATSTTYGNVAGATASEGVGNGCSGIEDDDVWYKFVATSFRQLVSLQVLEGSTGALNFAVYSGNCGVLSLLACAQANTFIINASNYVMGQVYYVRVWSTAAVPTYTPFIITVKEVSTCENAEPFCGSSPDDPYIFKNTTGLPSTSGQACLFTTPNPAYYTLKVSESGPIVYNIVQNTTFNAQGIPTGNGLDVDFVAWGPFTTPESCAQIGTTTCTCPNNTINPTFYPYGNIVDCSYSASATETLTIPNAIAGEYYIVLITNYNGSSGYIKLTQTNADEPNAGQTACADKIQLVAFVDTNSNGVKDETETNFTYGTFTYQKNNTGTVNYISNPLGIQSIYDENPTNTYDFNYEINSEYAPYYAETVTNFNDFSISVGSGTQVLYFPITITQSYSDVDVSITAINPPRPGFSHTHKIVYRNLGSLPTSGMLSYNKDNVNVTFNEIVPTPTTATADGFTYNFVNLLPGEVRYINVKMDVASIPTVNLDDVLSSAVSISSVENDINVGNNSFTLNQIVVASYDPNDKNEARGATIDIGQFDQEDYLFYTIRFQNTGTASADTVRIEDTLASEFDFASIRMISASHNYSMERINNKLIWTFKNINLPGAFQNELFSQGYVTFKIKLNAGFAVGDVIENTAEIYFDTNPAIITNTFQTTFTPNLGVGTFDVNDLVVYPNPAKELVNIQLKNSSETLKRIIIYDMIGKTIKNFAGNGGQQTTINVSNLSTGIYMIEITTDSNLKQIRKFMVH